VNYSEVSEGQWKLGELRQLDLPEFGALTVIFLRIRIGDSLASEAVILWA
jgi:hypothetical protein